MRYLLLFLTRPFVFKGRSTRTEFNLGIVSIFLIYTLELLILFNFPIPHAMNIIYISSFYYMVTLLSAAVRRSHDVGQTGWMVLIPYYGFYLMFAESKPGTNKWGPNPFNEEAVPLDFDLWNTPKT
ncbi:hypothetical protein COR50_08115 [Chitinophaga caeni]|uniref:DUF805 domain-containing protein n=1 Tax=Chitinophaga caeni TaxID=2029983 RepID=A0A291QTB8_9BACT|nr:DUF805 domain-containing protein [Chitinophaga caeni]ATL47151.1 hypothetical protein COR50_08115 [Chitinophaga caeni]